MDTLFNTKRYREEEKKSIEDAREILRFVGMDSYENEYAKNLPYGYQRKIEIARTIATGAEILLFDEPCAGMNSAEKVALGELILQINQRLHRTVFLIEHDMRFVMQLSNEITVLNQGQWIAHGTPGEIQQNPAVIEAYLGSGRKERKG